MSSGRSPLPPVSQGLGFENIEFRTLYQSSCGPKSLATLVIRKAEELRARELNSLRIDTSKVDFSSEELIVVGLGERSSDSYRVAIESVMHFTDQLGRSPVRTLVHYRKHIAASGANVSTHPCICIIALRKLAGETEFEAGR